MINYANNDVIVAPDGSWLNVLRQFKGDIIWTFKNRTAYTSQAYIDYIRDLNNNNVTVKSISIDNVEVSDSVKDNVSDGTGSGWLNIPPGSTLKYSIAYTTTPETLGRFNPKMQLRTMNGSTMLETSSFEYSCYYSDILCIHYNQLLDLPYYTSSYITTGYFMVFDASPYYDSFRFVIENTAGADPNTEMYLTMCKWWEYITESSHGSYRLNANMLPVISGTKTVNGVTTALTESELTKFRYRMTYGTTNGAVPMSGFDKLELVIGNEYYPGNALTYSTGGVNRTVSIYGTSGDTETLLDTRTIYSDTGSWVTPGLGGFPVERHLS